MKTFTFILILLISDFALAQLYQGPANGSVPNGVIVNTNNFSDFSGDNYSPLVRMRLRNTLTPPEYPDVNKIPPTGPVGSNEVYDPGITGIDAGSDANPILLRNFQGFNDPGNYIPPDPYFAAGPTHVMGVDNSRFRIWTKTGSLVKTINANAWFNSALGGASAFDPKVSYDQFNKRWIMVWLDQNNPPNQRGYFLISVSDDSNPIGDWYNWAIKNSLNGNIESGTWSDYQGVGFDNQALYITGRQFDFFGGFFTGCKIRIIGKTLLYANNAGMLTWTDLWDIRNPVNLGQTPDGIRPSVFYNTASEYYFMTFPFGSGTYVLLYKLINSLNNPSMTGVSVPVTAFNSPPPVQQLGGGSLSIENGGSGLRNEPTFRNGFLWLAHSVAFGSGYSGANYLKVNPATNSAVEDYTFGATGYYHFYTAISVDANQNLLLNFSRSSANEYVGAYFTSRLNTDPPGIFTPGMPLQTGKANYVKDFGSGRNRWGDYMGSWIDPSDQNNFWILTEYAETPANTWGCWVGNIRLVPFPTARVFTSVDSLDFGAKEVGTTSDTLRFKIYNYGADTLSITNMQNSTSQFLLASTFIYPVKLGFQDSVSVSMLFRPTNAGNLFDTLKITSNDPTNPNKPVYLKGRGYIINSASSGVMYGVTGTQENGVFITINISNGTGTTVGPTGYIQLTGISIRPSNNQVYGTFSGNPATTLVRINAAGGDAYPQAVIPLPDVRAIAFDLNNDLYCAVYSSGALFKISPTNGDTDLVGSTGVINLYGLSFNPLNGQLWGISLSGTVYKINKQTAASVTVGTTGFNLTTDITFNTQGRLFGVYGIGNIVSNLYSIDTSSGTGTPIGSTGKRGINGIAISPNPIGIEPISSTIPDKFELYQNYPNPFNPVTKIKFDLPKNIHVKITIYDILGREVEVLADEKMQAGKYSVNWHGTNYPSGVYFYRIETNEFADAKKMILVK